MNALAKTLRKAREENGALALASPEVKFEIDVETHDPLDVGMYVTRDTNRMVEEMMLLANQAAAEVRMSRTRAGITWNQAGVLSMCVCACFFFSLSLSLFLSLIQAILRAFPSSALLRRHQAPTEAMLKPLKRAAEGAGFGDVFDGSTSKTLAASLDKMQACFSVFKRKENTL